MVSRDTPHHRTVRSRSQKLRPVHILLVDSDRTNIDAFRRSFKNAGQPAKFRTAGSLREYQKIVATSKPDIVFMRSILPDGEALDILTSTPGSRLFPIVVMTDRKSKDYSARVAKAGALDCIVISPASAAGLPHIAAILLDNWKLLNKRAVLENRLLKNEKDFIADIDERKRTEKVLLENERFFRLLFTTSPDAILLFDSSSTPVPWQIIDCNEVACRMNGYTRDELIGKSVDMILPEPTTPEQRQAHLHLLQKKGVINIETMHRHRDGHVFPIEVSTSLVTRGGRQLILGIDRDITQRKAAEAELSRTQVLLRSTIEQSPVPIIVAAPDGTVTIVNDACREFLGIPCDQEMMPGHNLFTIKRTWQDLDADGTPVPAHDSPLARALRGIPTRRKEMRVHRKDGTERWEIVDGVPIVDENRNVIAGLIIFPDITDRKRMEAALIESEQQYRELIDCMNETVWIFEFDGTLIDVNRTAETLLGYTKDELLAIGLPGIDASVKKGAGPSVTRAMPADSFVILETTHRTKDGKIIPVEVYSSPATYQGKKVILSIARDITERKLAEEKLRQMQKMEGLGTLAGGVAHDFNNILGIILAYTTLMEKLGNDNKKIEDIVKTIIKTVERGRVLVQQILTFARKTDTDIAPINVNNIVTEIMALMSETFPKVLSFKQNVDVHLPTVNGDRSQLYQALLNLCVNARDAMPSSGTLTMNTYKVSGTDLRQLHRDAPERNFVCIEVCDTGEGMSENIKARIFEPFFTTKEKGRGTGLGLAVVFGIIQNHKGYIDVESNPGNGSTFRLYLPASPSEVPLGAETKEIIESIPGGSESILIVEDEAALADFLKVALTEKGYTVHTAGDGLTALALYRRYQKTINLVLTDFGMPKMTGLETCRRIKQLNPRAHLVLMTGYLDPGLKSEAEKAGIERILFKPAHLKDVLKTLRELLDRT